MFFRLYDPDKVTLSFGGIQISGWAPGEFVRLERATNDFVDVAGVFGEVTRLKSKDRRASVTFFLMHNSLSNDLLSIMHNIDHLVPNGAGVGAFLLHDGNGRSVYRSERAWIARPPTISMDIGPTTREWVISCENLIRYDGGGG